MKSSNETEESFAELEKSRKKSLQLVLSFLITLIILIITIGIIFVLFLTSPEAAKKEAEEVAFPAVSVVPAVAFEGGVQISTEGVVESRREVTLTAEVSGRLVEVSPRLVSGGRVREGEVLARIDLADYRSALEQAKASLARAQVSVADAGLALEQEEAKRDQALRDWKKLGRGKPSDLLSRKPQLKSAIARLESTRAEVLSATAEVARAERNLERTTIRAPFDAVVRSENVEVGAVLAPGAMLATLFSEHDLEVSLPLSLEDYALIKRNEAGQPEGEVALSATLGSRQIEWQGQILRTTGELNRSALTANVVVMIEPTDGEGEFRLPPPGLFVNASLEGQGLSQAIVVPREALRDGSRIAIVDEGGFLKFRQLQIIHSNASTVIANEGVAVGERIIITRLNGAIEGMEVSVKEDTSDQSSSKKGAN